MRFFQGITLAIFLGTMASTGAYAAPSEPQPGSELRRELLDTLRPLAAFDLGAPIEFRVMNMVVDGDIGFVQVMAQRPGGAAIDLADTPMVEWRYVEPYDIDGPRFEAFFIRRNGHWQITEYGLGSSDAWWFGYRCDVFGSLLRDMGC